MTAIVIPFRPASGTTARDLADVQRELPADDGWAVELIADAASVPWIAAEGPDGSAWAILRDAGRFVAAPDYGERPGFAGMTSAVDAARVVLQAARGA
jgi:hypothetical protein